jgi:hypothetical protein
MQLGLGNYHVKGSERKEDSGREGSHSDHASTQEKRVAAGSLEYLTNLFKGAIASPEVVNNPRVCKAVAHAP